MAEERRHVISIFVDNQYNVLSRVIGLFGRRGFNIDSLTVSTTDTPDVSRITVVFTGDEQTLRQIITQTEKLEVVRSVFDIPPEEGLYRELLLLKVSATKEDRSYILDVIKVYKGRILSMKPDGMIIELTGNPNKIDTFLEMMAAYGIKEVCRTGITAIEKYIEE